MKKKTSVSLSKQIWPLVSRAYFSVWLPVKKKSVFIHAKQNIFLEQPGFLKLKKCNCCAFVWSKFVYFFPTIIQFTFEQSIRHVRAPIELIWFWHCLICTIKTSWLVDLQHLVVRSAFVFEANCLKCFWTRTTQK